jgi:hypothetical protein
MRKSKYIESQIAEILREVESGAAVADVAREVFGRTDHPVSSVTLAKCSEGDRVCLGAALPAGF